MCFTLWLKFPRATYTVDNEAYLFAAILFMQTVYAAVAPPEGRLPHTRRQIAYFKCKHIYLSIRIPKIQVIVVLLSRFFIYVSSHINRKFMKTDKPYEINFPCQSTIRFIQPFYCYVKVVVLRYKFGQNLCHGSK